MPGILAEQSKVGLAEGKGGPISEGEAENQAVESSEDGGQNQKLKAALEELSLEKNSEADMDEDEQPTRLSSPDSGMKLERERERERERAMRK